MKMRLAGFLFIWAVFCAGAMAQTTSKPAPPFDVTALDGKTFKLADLKGKYIVLNFWFIGCGPCVKEIPQLNKLVTAYGKKDFVFLAFTMDDKPALELFLKKKPFTYNIIPKGLPVIMKYHDPTASDVTFPTHVIIDPKGEIGFQITGASGLVHLQKELKRLAALKKN